MNVKVRWDMTFRRDTITKIQIFVLEGPNNFPLPKENKNESQGGFPFSAFRRARDNLRSICSLGMRTLRYLVARSERAIAQKSRSSSYFCDRSPTL